jgi:adenosylhomocysteine nucleosidase
MIVVALKQELPVELLRSKYFTRCEVLVTGMGLLPAYTQTYTAIKEKKPSFVLNLGTAASLSSSTPVGEIVQAVEFFAHPLMHVCHNVSNVGVRLSNIPQVLHSSGEKPQAITYKKVKLSSGDLFVTQDNISSVLGLYRVDIVDMEAYAIALACKECGIPFYCVKYITDSVIATTSEEEWSSLLNKSSDILLSVAQELIPKLES